VSLPTFIVIGASRSGTTSLHHFLGQHPDIYMSPVKSPNYFVAGDALPPWEGRALQAMARHWIGDRQAYEGLFDAVRGEKAIGEVSPVYLQSRSAPRRILSACPDAKLIAVLREPVSRAYAHYLGRRRDGLEGRADFRTVVEQEVAAPLPDDVAFGSYIGASRYHHFLRGYFDCFPANRIRIHLFEDFVADPGRVLADLFGFLGVDAALGVDTSARYNASGEIGGPLRRFVWTRSVHLRTALRPYLPSRLRDVGQVLIGRALEKPSLAEDVRARIAEVLRPDVERLQALLDRDLSGWLKR
jgi:hypothetical protein